MIAPIWLKMLIEAPNSQSPIRPPVIASGTVARMTSGCTKLSNCAASTR